MPSSRNPWGSQAIDPNCIWRAISSDARFATLQSDAEASPGTSQLEDGPADHYRFRHPHEQRLRGNRGPLALRYGLGQDTRGHPPAVHGALDGGIRRWFGPGTTGAA